MHIKNRNNMKVHSLQVSIGKAQKSKPFGSADYNAHQPARMQQVQTRVKHRLWFLKPLSTGSMLKGPQLVDLVNITELPLQKKKIVHITMHKMIRHN